MSSEEKFVTECGYVPITAVVKISNRRNTRVANYARVYIARAFIPKEVYGKTEPEHDGKKRLRTNEYIFNSRFSLRAVHKRLKRKCKKN